MKYSQNLVWKAIYEFCPTYQSVKENGISLNMPSCIEDAALRVFMLIGNNGISSLGTDKAYAAYILQNALKELNEVGWMTFGKQEEYWM